MRGDQIAARTVGDQVPAEHAGAATDPRGLRGIERLYRGSRRGRRNRRLGMGRYEFDTSSVGCRPRSRRGVFSNGDSQDARIVLARLLEDEKANCRVRVVSRRQHALGQDDGSRISRAWIGHPCGAGSTCFRRARYVVGRDSQVSDFCSLSASDCRAKPRRNAATPVKRNIAAVGRGMSVHIAKA